MLWKDFLAYEYLGNSISNYLWFAGILLFGFLFKTILSKLLSGILFRVVKHFSQEDNLPAFRRLLIQPLEMLLFLVFLYFAFEVLEPPLNLTEAASAKEPILKRLAYRTYQIFVLVAATWVITRFVDFFGLIFTHRASKTASKLDDQLIPFFKDFTKALIWIFAFMIILGSVFGVNVAGLVAGLGVGGLAIAFAAKESLENLLASFTIFLDHPFVIGDLVEVNGITGVIEKIGFRSTRIRTLEKTFVTVPNKNMIDKPLNNLSLRTFRRVNFDLDLTYDTTSEQIRAVTRDVQALLDSHPRTNQDGRVRFHHLGPHSKVVMVLYFIDTMDWNEYIDIREEITYKLVDIVERHGASFAYPTQSLVLQQPGQQYTNLQKQPMPAPLDNTDLK